MVSTEKHLLELKNISAKVSRYWAHQRGLESELFVLQYYKGRGYIFLTQRLKTPFAEVDLLFRAPQGHLLMVEVKTVNLSEFQVYRISRRQKVRLLRALYYLIEQYDCLVEVHWAFVTKTGEVQVIEDISG